jgi:hypothetical protein
LSSITTELPALLFDVSADGFSDLQFMKNKEDINIDKKIFFFISVTI